MAFELSVNEYVSDKSYGMHKEELEKLILDIKVN